MILAVIIVLLVFSAYHTFKFATLRSQKSRLLASVNRISSSEVDRANIGSISFLVAGWNCSADIEPFVSAFRALPLDNKQLVMCVGGKDDSYQRACTLHGDDVLVFEQVPGMGKQKALRASLPHATGDWIYLTDIDSRIYADCVVKMASALASAPCECVTGGMAPLKEQERDSFVTAQWGIDRYGNLMTGEFTSGILGANTLLTRNALKDSGDFGQEAPSGTDYTLAKELLKAGHKILHLKGAEVRTEFSTHLDNYVKRRSRWLRNVLVLGRNYKCYTEVRSVLVTIVLAYLYPVLMIAGWFSQWIWVLFVLLFMHSYLNRVRYGKLSGVRTSAVGIIGTIVGDALAAMRAGHEALIGTVRW